MMALQPRSWHPSTRVPLPFLLPAVTGMSHPVSMVQPQPHSLPLGLSPGPASACFFPWKPPICKTGGGGLCLE